MRWPTSNNHLARAAAVAIGAAHAAQYWLPFEDAFITYRYAENLARGAGLAYNPGERVEGFTSFLWTIVLAAAAWCGLPTPAASQALSLACGLGLVWTAGGIARALATRDGEAPPPPWIELAAGGLVALDGTFAYYAPSGMETAAFALAVALAVRFAVEERPRRGLRVGLALAAAALLRPEGAGFALLVASGLALDRASRRDALAALAAFAAIFAPYFAARWAWFGWPLPNTFYAKATPSGGVLFAGLRAAEAYLTSHLGWIGLGCSIAVAWRTTRGRPGAIVVAAVVVGAAVDVVLVGGDAFPLHRFFLPAMAPAAAATAAAASLLRGTARRRAAASAALVAYGAVTLAASLVPTRTALVSRPISERRRVLDIARMNEQYFVVGRWLRDHAPKGALLATNAAGIVPYTSELRALDMLGLTDAHIAHAPIALGRGALGHEKHDAAYVLSRDPDVVLLGLPVFATRPVQPNELETWVGQWFPFLPGDEELWRSPVFRERYAPLGVDVGGGRWLILFVRRRP